MKKLVKKVSRGILKAEQRFYGLDPRVRMGIGITGMLAGLAITVKGAMIVANAVNLLGTVA